MALQIGSRQLEVVRFLLDGRLDDSGLLLALVHAIVLLLLFGDAGLVGGLLVPLVGLGGLLEDREFFQVAALLLLLDDPGHQLDELIVVGPGVGQQFRVNQHIKDVDFE